MICTYWQSQYIFIWTFVTDCQFITIFLIHNFSLKKIWLSRLYHAQKSASEISFIVPGSCLEEWGRGEGKDGHSMKKSGSEPYILYNIKSQPLFKISVLHFFG